MSFDENASSDKIIYTRIQNKRGTSEAWAQKSNEGFIPLDGEIIVYSPDDTCSSPRIKIGDGHNEVNDLPFTEPYELPRIRFANHYAIDNEDGSRTFVFTVENLGGGTLQVGDLLQICCRRRYSSNSGIRKYKLRKQLEYIITEEDINQRFLKLEYNVASGECSHDKWLFKNDRNSFKASSLSPLYFRFKRPIIDGQGREINAIFSNVETVWKTYIQEEPFWTLLIK